MRRWGALTLAGLALAAGCVPTDPGPPPPPPPISLVSVASGGAQGDGASVGAAVSDDGRFVAFQSSAANLVAADTNGVADIFVRDRVSGVTERVSVATGGAQADGGSFRPSISGDGRFVAFESSASNLVAGDTNGEFDTFVHDRVSGVTERVSVATGGGQGDAGSLRTSLSVDGRFVAFESSASNLVAGDTNGVLDTFVRDRQLGVTERVSVATGGGQGDGESLRAWLSGDGRFVAFDSLATNLVVSDTNGVSDIFVRDRQLGVTVRVSVATGGTQADDASIRPVISADGAFVTFDSLATNLVTGDTNARNDIFVHDLHSGVTERASVGAGGTQADDNSIKPVISGDGRYVVFASFATNLVTGDTNAVTDVFVRDRLAGTTTRVSVPAGGGQADGGSLRPSVAAGGGIVAFDSVATNLVPGDANAVSDVFAAVI